MLSASLVATSAWAADPPPGAGGSAPPADANSGAAPVAAPLAEPSDPAKASSPDPSAPPAADPGAPEAASGSAAEEPLSSPGAEAAAPDSAGPAEEFATEEEAAPEPSPASGSLRLGYWSSNRKLDDVQNIGSVALWTRIAPKFGRHVLLVADGWVRYDDLFRRSAPAGTLREAYLDFSLGAVDFRVGRQIVVWGRADGVNPTDNISPRDLTLLVPDDDDQRSGATATKTNVYLGSFTLSGMWLPGFRPHVIPIPPLPAGVVAHETSPSFRQSLGQGAFKLEQTGGALDWSLSYFGGYDKYPDFALGTMSATETQVLLRHERIHVVGGDFASVVGKYGVRGEASFTFTKDTNGTDPTIKNPFLYLVLGVDRTFFENLNVNAQYLLRVITHFQDPFQIQDPLLRNLAVQGDTLNNQLDPIQNGGTLRIHDRWYNETLQAELMGAFWFPRFNYLLRGRVSYALSDRWKIIVGADYFNGQLPSFFRTFEKNTTAFAEARLGF